MTGLLVSLPLSFFPLLELGADIGSLAFLAFPYSFQEFEIFKSYEPFSRLLPYLVSQGSSRAKTLSTSKPLRPAINSRCTVRGLD